MVSQYNGQTLQNLPIDIVSTKDDESSLPTCTFATVSSATSTVDLTAPCRPNYRWNWLVHAMLSTNCFYLTHILPTVHYLHLYLNYRSSFTITPSSLLISSLVPPPQTQQASLAATLSPFKCPYSLHQWLTPYMSQVSECRLVHTGAVGWVWGESPPRRRSRQWVEEEVVVEGGGGHVGGG